MSPKDLVLSNFTIKHCSEDNVFINLFEKDGQMESLLK